MTRCSTTLKTPSMRTAAPSWMAPESDALLMEIEDKTPMIETKALLTDLFERLQRREKPREAG
jgi:hypothetical protein